MAHVLFVCTGNICRSPMAEAFLRSALRRRLGDGAPTVSSAGLIARDGARATADAATAAAERGEDLSRHAARRLRREHVDRADLIVGLAAEHRDEIAHDFPGAAARTFALKGLVRGFEGTGDEAGGALLDEDVADPLGLPLEDYRAVASEIEAWCERLADALAHREAVLSAPED